MIEPEISRRCPDCGASIRERAFFCPECGRELERVVKKTAVANQTPIEKADSVAENGGDAVSDYAGAATTAGEELPRQATKPLGSRGVAQARSKRPAVRPLVVQNGHESAEDKGHRASALAREVIEENLLPRMEKLRKASSVVIDQAAYDPSLRFVLVAALLFAIFLVILLLNELV